MLAHANYLLIFEGYKPQPADVARLFQTLPKVDQSPLPALEGSLPPGGLVPNSQRYVIGPAGLAAFDPGIPAGVAAFHLGSEAQIGTYKAAGGEMTLAVFSTRLRPSPGTGWRRCRNCLALSRNGADLWWR